MPDFPPGTPSWADLAAPDKEAAAHFYSGLFGWEAEAAGPPEETRGYSFFKLDGKQVAGFGPPGPGEPPSWRTYVATADADETTSKVRDAGDNVVLEPMDVMDVGRMAVFMDTTGAVICVWQPKEHRGADVVNEPGSYAWSELSTREPQKAEPFYTAVFGWEPRTNPMNGGSYTTWHLDDKAVAGMIEMGQDWPTEVPSHWLIYFAVDDTDGAADKARELGGGVTVPPRDIPEVGRFAVLSDPNGAHFCVIALAPEMKEAR